MPNITVRFNKDLILNSGYSIKKEKGDAIDDTYFGFFDEADVVIYGPKSQYITKIKLEDMDRLIKNGVVKIINC